MKIHPDEQRMNYLSALDRSLQRRIDEHCKRHGEPTYSRKTLVLALDDTACWGDTYREAVDAAMKHDGYL